ncbi:hypothetical protein [Brachybacterium alimentarium]|uniref:hypothetical protein n=1 Tax=Brachybacterium alimentarium TaxID=47845 RepID=UPI0011C03917|nr:hypothetical protein [Brachybacterium alimentarium]
MDDVGDDRGAVEVDVDDGGQLRVEVSLACAFFRVLFERAGVEHGLESAWAGLGGCFEADESDVGIGGVGGVGDDGAVCGGEVLVDSFEVDAPGRG